MRIQESLYAGVKRAHLFDSPIPNIYDRGRFVNLSALPEYRQEQIVGVTVARNLLGPGWVSRVENASGFPDPLQLVIDHVGYYLTLAVAPSDLQHSRNGRFAQLLRQLHAR